MKDETNDEVTGEANGEVIGRENCKIKYLLNSHIQ